MSNQHPSSFRRQLRPTAEVRELVRNNAQFINFACLITFIIAQSPILRVVPRISHVFIIILCNLHELSAFLVKNSIIIGCDCFTSWLYVNDRP